MNILTFDIEEWYLEKVLHGGRASKYRQYDEMFARLLDELDVRGIKATFFCVGRLAEEFPAVVKNISARGHDIGCHSNVHKWLNKMTVEELRKDTAEALKALEDVSGQKVTSFRAPAFSITRENKWAVNVLAECGIESDASIFPTSRDFGGYKVFPQDTPCRISHDGAVLKEYPVSMTSVLGRRMAYSGGGYFRLLPYWMIEKTMAKRDYNIFYFHLNDLINQKIAFMNRTEYESYFKEPGTLKNRLVRYFKSNIGTTDARHKLQKLLYSVDFMCIREVDKIIDWSKTNVIQL